MVWPITLRGPSLARSCYGPNCGQVNALRGELTFNPPLTHAGNASRSARIPEIEMPRECPPASVLSQQASSPLSGAGGTFDQGCGSGGACVSRKSQRCGEGAGGSGGRSVCEREAGAHRCIDRATRGGCGTGRRGSGAKVVKTRPSSADRGIGRGCGYNVGRHGVL